MMLEIEKKFKNISKIEITIGAFSILGVGGAFIGMPILAMSGIGLSFLYSGYFNYKNITSNHPLSILNAWSTPFYKKVFKKWFDNYIDSSENLTEKKYKIIFIKLWLDEKYLSLYNLYDDKQKIEKLNEEMKKSKETSFNIKDIFENEMEIWSQDFLNEDIKDNKIENLMIAKKVYKDFKSMGILGNNFFYWTLDAFRICFYLQDYTLTPQDINNIQNDIENRNKKNKDILLYENNNEQLHYNINKLLDNNSIETLSKIMKMFENIKSWDDERIVLNKEEIYNLFSKKIDYMKLDSKMKVHSLEINTKSKRTKI